MKMKLDDTPTYDLPVQIPVRLQDGSSKKVGVRLRVNRLDQDDFAEMIQRYAESIDPTLAARVKEARNEGELQQLAEQLEAEQAEPKRPIDAMRVELRAIVVGWEDSDFDPPVEFSAARFDALLRKPAATQAIFYALSESIPTANQKNSQRSP